MTSFDLLPWLLGLAVGLLVWWHTLGARNVARRAAKRHCREHGLYFIDELAFKGWRLDRGRPNGWRIRRSYCFEFYQRGDQRYTGHVDVVGHRAARVHLEPHPTPDEAR
ncbi:DUF3301 domain-containing protein [Salinisphaera sp. USBA-960]|uniref:DUF3301 domain-containing protein n=1 Tax=Salinisphaera orenii TaxID=856731 RepID=UPI000DBE8178|nr:DUF3301 domain-containing protein [Salifodinibacter halophilus]NNC27150.1 DUF3301 domain-containing protein [Salifodinibacter halophilus]